MPVGQFASNYRARLQGSNNGEQWPAGRGMAFRIRGAASLAATISPCSLSMVCPLQVVSIISTLPRSNIYRTKDASASALYGSRAANGVVLINYQARQTGDAKVELNIIMACKRSRRTECQNDECKSIATFMNERYQDQ